MNVECIGYVLLCYGLNHLYHSNSVENKMCYVPVQRIQDLRYTDCLKGFPLTFNILAERPKSNFIAYALLFIYNQKITLM